MKTMRKKCLKQSLSILLVVIFVCSMIPTASGANGELLTWTIQRMYAPGTYTFDIGVWVIDMGYTTTQNVFTLTVNPRDTN